VEEALLRIDPAQDPFLGMTIDGKYLIEERLGRGAMAGGVYRARHAGTGGFVAIKLVRADLVPDESFIRRFYVEAQNTHRLHHPNTVRVSDFGRTAEGVLYLVMEFLPGRMLAAVLEKDAPLPTARVVHIVEQMLKSLGEAHSLGMVHRDVKPENVMLLDQFGEPDFVKVLDFGIARSLNAGGVGTRGAIGTPEFMSPEQWEGKSIDGRADLYAVGCVMYEMLGGRLPFERERSGTEEVVVCMTAHLTKVPDPLIDVCPWVPKALSLLVMELLAKKPQERPSNADEVLQRLNAIKSSGVLNDSPPPRSGIRPKPAATTPSPLPSASDVEAASQGPAEPKADAPPPASGRRGTPGTPGHPESARADGPPRFPAEPPQEKTAIIEVAPSSERPKPGVSQDPNAATMVIDAAREIQAASARYDEPRAAAPARKKAAVVREPPKAVVAPPPQSPGPPPDVRSRDTQPVPARAGRTGLWLWLVAALLLVLVLGAAGTVVAVYAYSEEEEPAPVPAGPADSSSLPVPTRVTMPPAPAEEASRDIVDTGPDLDATDDAAVERALDTNQLTSDAISVRFPSDGGAEGPTDEPPAKAGKHFRHVKRGGKGVELPKLRLDKPGKSAP
jgi:serine/threonine-protein kinase